MIYIVVYGVGMVVCIEQYPSKLDIQEMEVKTEVFPSLPQVIQYTQALVDNSSCSVQYSDIGIITPYRKQVREVHIICMRA